MYDGKAQPSLMFTFISFPVHIYTRSMQSMFGASAARRYLHICNNKSYISIFPQLAKASLASLALTQSLSGSAW